MEGVKQAQDQHIVIDLYRREDGGLCIGGRGDARGVIISAATPDDALAKLWPAMHALGLPITKHDY
jgi:hypothetical protein